MKQLKFFTIIILILTTGYFVFAENISFSADVMRADLAKGRERTQLTGNAHLFTEDTKIYADSIELYGEDFNFARCSGRVKVSKETDELEISCDNLFFNRKEKILRLQGNAVMEDRKNEIIIKGGIIENREKDDITLIQINARILKEDLICRAQIARYYRKEQRLELYGMPVVIKKKDEYRAARITINLENDEVILEGDVHAAMEYKDESGKTEEAPLPKATPPGTK